MRHNVLVVEDDGDLREIVCEVLEGAGYEARPATGGEDALAQLGEHKQADLILLDLTMPGMSGFELRERLLRNPKLRAIPVVIMTASRGFDLGVLAASGVLLKPLDATQLLQEIEKVLARRVTNGAPS